MEPPPGHDFIDWLIALPPEMETTFREEVERIEQETKMRITRYGSITDP